VFVGVFHEFLLGDEALVANKTLVRSNVHLALHVQTETGQVFECLSTKGALQGMGLSVFDVILPL